MGYINLVELAQERAKAHLQKGMLVIDATVGNGHDTLMLAEAVGAKGEVFGFDIQQTALTATQERLSDAGVLDRVKLIKGSHADMRKLLPQSAMNGVDLVMFNLGYLPGGDRELITKTDSTICALDAALSLLSSQGAISVIAYPGHVGGDSESEVVSVWCDALDGEEYRVERVFPETKRGGAPLWFWIQKI